MQPLLLISKSSMLRIEFRPTGQCKTLLDPRMLISRSETYSQTKTLCLTSSKQFGLCQDQNSPLDNTANGKGKVMYQYLPSNLQKKVKVQLLNYQKANVDCLLLCRRQNHCKYRGHFDTYCQNGLFCCVFLLRIFHKL